MIPREMNKDELMAEAKSLVQQIKDAEEEIDSLQMQLDDVQYWFRCKAGDLEMLERLVGRVR